MSIPSNATRTPTHQVVLVGGGHAHVHVLEGFADQPPPDAHVTLVVDQPIAVYSGMVPGLVAGQYTAAELSIDVRPLAARVGAKVILAPAVRVDTANRRIDLDGADPVPYDLAAFDIGSTVAGLDLPGVREHALPTRPIGRFVQRVGEIVDRAKADTHAWRIVVVGGGSGGVELAFTLQHRLSAETGRAVSALLLEAGPRILRGYPSSLVRRVERLAGPRRVELRCSRRVERAEAGAVHLEDGTTEPFDLLVWVTGAVSHPLFTDSGLCTDERGFLRVRPTLQAEQHDDLFATGDCATLIEHPQTPKAGVYAVRQGPYITDNLRAALDGAPLRAYVPQRDFLTLLNVAGGRALGAKWGFGFGGRWVMALKDHIDRKFMRRFQVT